jgi:hypothetical protein
LVLVSPANMKNLKMNSRSNSSGQVLVILIILLGLLGAGAWWLFSNKQAMTTEGRKFGREAIQRIVVQHDVKFFGDHLSPQARLQFPPSMQQQFIAKFQELGAPVGSVDVQGDILFQSHFFEPRGNFHARLNYPAGPYEINISVSHPVGRWQIDDISFAPATAQ